MVLVVKTLPANAGDIRDADLIPGSERSPGGGPNNPLQYSCLENPMDRGAWRAVVHRVTQSQTRPKPLSTYVCTKLLQLCLTLHDSMNCSPPGFSVHGILQARILEWVVISFSRGSSQPRDQTQVSYITSRCFIL